MTKTIKIRIKTKKRKNNPNSSSEMDQNMREMLNTLGFLDLETLPSMKQLREHFRKLTIQRHPDKGGINEEFKELCKAFETIGKMIEEEDSLDEEDEEEKEARHRFKEEVWER